MTITHKILTIAIASAFLFTGCSKKEEEPQLTEADVQAAADAAAQKAVAESDAKNQSKLDQLREDSQAQLAAKAAEMEKQLAEEKAKLQEELKGQLAKQAADLREEFASNNSALKSQLDSLTDKFNSLKDKLPENVVDSVSSKLPDLRSSLGNLESITSNFNPSSLEQLQELKTKYEAELAIARRVADELLKLIGKGSLSDLLPSL